MWSLTIDSIEKLTDLLVVSPTNSTIKINSIDRIRNDCEVKLRNFFSSTNYGSELSNSLLPFVKDATRECKLDEFANTTVAIDASTWLYKAVFSCADKVFQKIPTEIYIDIFIDRTFQLTRRNIKPIFVFDGLPLPAKRPTNDKRKKEKEKYKKQAKKLIEDERNGKVISRQQLLDICRRCIEITPDIYEPIIEKLKKMEIDCIMAPYEADAQLAFLQLNRLTEAVITEDSDLILFGCDKIIYKLDNEGNGILFELKQLTKDFGQKMNFFKFRRACILSGCDYLNGIHRIGIKTAMKAFRLTNKTDMNIVVRELGRNLNMKRIEIPEKFVEEFEKAEFTFQHQLIMNPLKQKMEPLTPIPVTILHRLKIEEIDDIFDENLHQYFDINQPHLYNAGIYLDEKFSVSFAQCNVDRRTYEIRKNHSNFHEISNFKETSIWNKNYKNSQSNFIEGKIKHDFPDYKIPDEIKENILSSSDKVKILNVSKFKSSWHSKLCAEEIGEDLENNSNIINSEENEENEKMRETIKKIEENRDRPMENYIKKTQNLIIDKENIKMEMDDGKENVEMMKSNLKRSASSLAYLLNSDDGIISSKLRKSSSIYFQNN
ncbi:hypothetical protein SNEBB_009365 [Seison nebaliae]|nr:hypothetical protein SNEBB_009365 [Seison nebaliae]